MIITNESIILRSRKYGDTSKLVAIFTKDYGKQSLLAKGSRTAKNKFGSSLDPLSYSLVSFYKKPNTTLHLLSNAEIIKPLRNLYNSFDHLTTGLLILESLTLTLEEDVPNPDLFNISLNAIEALNKLNNNPYPIFLLFQIELARDLGFSLDFLNEFDCDYIHKKRNSNLFLSYSKGTIIENGNYIEKNSFRFEPRLLIILKSILENSFENCSDVIISNDEFSKLHSFFIEYFSFHLEKRLYYRSQSLINLMN